MKLFLKIILSVFILFILVAGSGMFYLSRGLDAGNKLSINKVNLSSINDGTYNGKYESGRWSNEVSVTVIGHKITKLDVAKDVRFPKPEVTQELLSRIVKNQNTDVDVISGSTVTCKAYLKSVENALKK